MTSPPSRRQYRLCTRCVMDTSDPDITFNDLGQCNHCVEFFETAKSVWFPNEEGQSKLDATLSQIKAVGEGRQYDSILGLSGGVDSSYLAIKVKEMGLRPLVVHVDAGWNSELAVANIEAIIKYCDYDLYTHVVDWEEMRDLQLAYLRAGVANQDVPQDHIFFSILYHIANKKGIRFVLSGGNVATESIFPASWHGNAMDSVNLKAIHKEFGEGKLSQYKTVSFFEYYFWYPIIKRMRTVRLLDYIIYDKAKATVELEETIGYKPYARKHGESQFTKFFQNYYLPTKFGFDKRRPHLASMIVSGQISREDALARLEEPLYDPEELENDVEYFCKKLRIGRSEFDELMAQPHRKYSDFKNWDVYYHLLKKVQSFVSSVSGRTIRIH